MENNSKCWVNESDNSDFSIYNIPFGIVKFNGNYSVASRICNNVILIDKLSELGYLKNINIDSECYKSNYLNSLMKNGKAKTSELRNEIISIFTSDELKNNEQHKKEILKNINEVEMQMPIEIGDYTDFYSSIEHATNVGTMFRDPNNALLPNWKYIPVGYHGRASSIILSGQEIHRPKGQIKPNEDEPPIFSPCRLLDFELEMAFITFDGKPLGKSISTAEADDYIFGMCLFNDWSARDIQKWEYVPLGPFLAKNFASSMSPWIVTLDALDPFRVEGPKQEPEVLDYLKYSGNKNIDINLEVIIKPEKSEEKVVSKSNYKYMYWNMNQQLAHHTVNGCNIRCGDVMASGTISGPTPDSYGSMLELSWKGTKPIAMPDGSERKFINDFDTVIMKGYCEKDNIRVGFGEVSTKVLPAI
jgi:fumarylacetoacetase